MLEFENIIVHVLDNEHDTCVLAQTCTELPEAIQQILQSKCEKLWQSTLGRRGQFQAESKVKAWLSSDLNDTQTFIDCTQKLAQHIFATKKECALFTATDLIAALVKRDGRRYFLLLENIYQEAVMHQVKEQAGEIQVELIPCQTLLSPQLRRQERACTIELSDHSVQCVENSISVQGEKKHLYADIVLRCTTQPSYQEVVKTVTAATEVMSEKYDMEKLALTSQVKSMLVDSVEQQKPLHVDTLAQQLFAEKPQIKADFCQELKNQGIPVQIELEPIKAKKAEKVQKLKTDNGIEITIPVDYMNSTEFVEFRNAPDGRLSIELKNIAHITSR